MSAISIRPIRLEEVDEAIEIMRASFETHTLSHTIYGQSGIGNFVKDSVGQPGITPEREYIVAVDEQSKNVLGFADYDIRRPGHPHLAYICVSSAARNRGVATRLISHYIDRHPEGVKLSLDVFNHNKAAKRLYDKLGFTTLGTSSIWYGREIASNEANYKIQVTELQTSLASQYRYDFSTLKIQYKDRLEQVGRLGSKTVRLTSESAFKNDEFLAALKTTFPEIQRAFFVANALMEDDSVPCTKILESSRMSVSCRNTNSENHPNHRPTSNV